MICWILVKQVTSIALTTFGKWFAFGLDWEILFFRLFYGKLGVVRVLTSQWGFTRPSSICFSLGLVRDIVPLLIHTNSVLSIDCIAVKKQLYHVVKMVEKHAYFSQKWKKSFYPCSITISLLIAISRLSQLWYQGWKSHA